MHTLEPIVTALVWPSNKKEPCIAYRYIYWTSIRAGSAELCSIHTYTPCSSQTWVMYKDLLAGDAHSLHPDKVNLQLSVLCYHFWHCSSQTNFRAHKEYRSHHDKSNMCRSDITVTQVLTQCTFLVLMSMPADWWLLLGGRHMNCIRKQCCFVYMHGIYVADSQESWKLR